MQMPLAQPGELAIGATNLKLNYEAWHLGRNDNMEIDDYEVAISLTEKLAANLPITAYPTKNMIKGLKAQGQTIDPNQEFSISEVNYSGDMGGIMCVLKSDSQAEALTIVSITHLTLDSNHPLAPEIEAYQRQRTHRLAIQDSRGFAAEMLKQRAVGAKKKSRKGFGK
jgi:hypothetical protein